MPTTPTTTQPLAVHDVVSEIKSLHDEICLSATSTLAKAVKTGDLLIELKALLGHSKWLPFVEEFLPFGDRTARNYMRVARNKDSLTDAEASEMLLTSAYKRLARPSTSAIQSRGESIPKGSRVIDVASEVERIAPERQEVASAPVKSNEVQPGDAVARDLVTEEHGHPDENITNCKPHESDASDPLGSPLAQPCSPVTDVQPAVIDPKTCYSLADGRSLPLPVDGCLTIPQLRTGLGRLTIVAKILNGGPASKALIARLESGFLRITAAAFEVAGADADQTDKEVAIESLRAVANTIENAA